MLPSCDCSGRQVRSRPEPEGSPDLKVQLRALSLLQQQLPLKALAQLCQACSGDTLVAACCRCSSRCASLAAHPSAGCCSGLVCWPRRRPCCRACHPALAAICCCCAAAAAVEPESWDAPGRAFLQQILEPLILCQAVLRLSLPVGSDLPQLHQRLQQHSKRVQAERGGRELEAPGRQQQQLQVKELQQQQLLPLTSASAALSVDSRSTSAACASKAAISLSLLALSAAMRCCSSATAASP